MVIYGLIDIDDFTTFNLINGFEKGNEILRMLEDISIRALEPNVWRKLDSDEFIFLMDGSFEENRQKFSDLLLNSKKQLKITISIGLSELKFECGFEQIINQLKSNLLIAKCNGKNKFCLQ